MEKTNARTNWFLKVRLGKPTEFLGARKRIIRRLLAGRLSRNKARRDKDHKGSLYRRYLGRLREKQFFRHDLTPEKVTMRSSMEHTPEVQFILTPSSEALWSHFESLKTGKWALVSPINFVLAKIHQSKAYVFSDSVVCLGGSPMYDHSGNVEGRWIEHCKGGESNQEF